MGGAASGEVEGFDQSHRTSQPQGWKKSPELLPLQGLSKSEGSQVRMNPEGAAHGVDSWVQGLPLCPEPSFS